MKNSLKYLAVRGWRRPITISFSTGSIFPLQSRQRVRGFIRPLRSSFIITSFNCSKESEERTQNERSAFSSLASLMFFESMILFSSFETERIFPLVILFEYDVSKPRRRRYLASFPRWASHKNKGSLRGLSLSAFIPEILRIIEALQTSDRENVATPANWFPGMPLILPYPKTYKELKNRLLNSVEREYVLHGDLHHDNIIQDGENWIVIE